MFAICRGRGFALEFPNGWEVSVMWGPGNYGDHHGDALVQDNTDPDSPGQIAAAGGSYVSSRAEVAVLGGNHWYDVEGNCVCPKGYAVSAYQTVSDVLAIMVKVAALAPPPEKP